MPSISYETGFRVAIQRNQSASIRFRGRFSDERNSATKKSGKSPRTASDEPVRSATAVPRAPNERQTSDARAISTSTPAGPAWKWTPTTRAMTK